MDYLFGINIRVQEFGLTHGCCARGCCLAWHIIILHGLAFKDSTKQVSALTTRIVKPLIVISIILPIIYGVITFFLGLILCNVADAFSLHYQVHLLILEPKC